MANWYTADTHFGHENVIPFCGRPFRHAGHMDSMLIESMWKVVQPEDDENGGAIVGHGSGGMSLLRAA